MPNLADHVGSTVTKLILVGDPGSGKTGALASLAGAGKNLRILDLDNGIDIIANMLRDPKSPYGPEALGRVKYETVTDPLKMLPSGRLVPSKATVWERAIKLLENWPGCGPIAEWGPEDVLVIDSLTMISRAAFNWVLSLNARLGKRPEQSDYYTAQQLIESMLEMVTTESVKCNVVVIAHIKMIEVNNVPKGFPKTIGKALSPDVGANFNSILYVQKSGSGSSVKRKIYTNPVGPIELKNSNPYRVKADYPLETGLADYFRDVQQRPEVAQKGDSNAPKVTPIEQGGKKTAVGGA
jgi:hypothetical protein